MEYRVHLLFRRVRLFLSVVDNNKLFFTAQLPLPSALAVLQLCFPCPNRCLDCVNLRNLRHRVGATVGPFYTRRVFGIIRN